ncbi:MAG: TIGR03643 family protein [Oceanicoccus sp.]|uniref:TIGR03643 family protein n=1 Tax=Oceanicoccus sp. TaxID=2691044 RepID=UPI002619428B|nr:TIGR03643 family protein [Oceanicoccus sp.]MCP3908309.1 TIGR03643 family protein [Oceanicoccus sp.]
MSRANHNTSKFSALTADELDRVIEMAWEDRTPFEAITAQFGLSESSVIALMRLNQKPRSFQNWRARVTGRITKHRQKRPAGVERGYCATQYKASQYRRARRKTN